MTSRLLKLRDSLLTACLLALAAGLAAPTPALAAPGDLVPAFGTGGVVTHNPSSADDFLSDIAVDSNGIYLIGTDSFTQWRIEKRDPTTGALISSFGTGGVVTFQPPDAGEAYAIALNATALYTAGAEGVYLGGDTRWRIEKRDPTTGALISSFGTGGVVTSDPSSNGDAAVSIAIDTSGIYIGGTADWGGLEEWRIEKRDLTTGALISSFGTGGVVTGNFGAGDEFQALTLDASALYAVGLDSGAQWRIEKRDLTTGALISSFGTGGVVTSNPSPRLDVPRAITIDTTALYVAGYDIVIINNPAWRIEKRDLTTGALIPAFGTGGVVTSNPTNSQDTANAIAIDASGIYVAGSDPAPGSYQWRIEKRDLTTGALISTFGTSGVVTSNPGSSSDEAGTILVAGEIYVAGYDSSPGNSQWRIEKRESGAVVTPPPTVNLSAFPATINEGESSTLQWTSTDATACAAVSPAGWTASTATSGAEVVWPAATTTYIIECTGTGGTTQQSTTVTVTAPCVPGWTLTVVDSGGVSKLYHPSIAIGTDGLPVISYLDTTNSDLKVAKCGNADCTSGNTLTTVDSAGSVGWDNDMTIGTDGLPVISYLDGTNVDLKVAKCGNASCSSGNTITTVDSTGNVGRETTITIGADGLPVISYRDSTNVDLKVAKCGNASCSSGNTITTVDSTGNVGYGPSIATGTDGLPVISYLDGTNVDLKVAKCGNASCSSGNTITTVDSTSTAGQFSISIAIAPDGLPVISYLDTTNDELKVAKCGNASCSSGNTITTVDSTGTVVGSEDVSSIAIGSNGFPVVSYPENTNNDLKIVKCGNANCSSGNSITTVASGGSIGYDTSLAIGADGLPVIAGFNGTNIDLKVAKENNCGGGGPAPTITLDAVPSTINSGDSSTLTWTSTDAASCAAVSPAGWTAKTTVNDSELVTNITATTTYIIACTGPGGTSQQSATVTVSGGGGGGCGQQIYDGTTTITISCEDPPVSPLRTGKDATTYGIQLVDPSDPNASKLRIQTPTGVKALRKQ